MTFQYWQDTHVPTLSYYK